MKNYWLDKKAERERRKAERDAFIKQLQKGIFLQAMTLDAALKRLTKSYKKNTADR